MREDCKNGSDGFRFRAWGLGFSTKDVGLRVYGLGFKAWGWAWGLGLGV